MMSELQFDVCMSASVSDIGFSTTSGDQRRICENLRLSGRLVGMARFSEVNSSELKFPPSMCCLSVFEAMSISIKCIGIKKVFIRCTLSPEIS